LPPLDDTLNDKLYVYQVHIIIMLTCSINTTCY